MDLYLSIKELDHQLFIFLQMDQEIIHNITGSQYYYNCKLICYKDLIRLMIIV